MRGFPRHVHNSDLAGYQSHAREGGIVFASGRKHERDPTQDPGRHPAFGKTPHEDGLKPQHVQHDVVNLQGFNSLRHPHFGTARWGKLPAMPIRAQCSMPAECTLATILNRYEYLNLKDICTEQAPSRLNCTYSVWRLARSENAPSGKLVRSLKAMSLSKRDIVRQTQGSTHGVCQRMPAERQHHHCKGHIRSQRLTSGWCQIIVESARQTETQSLSTFNHRENKYWLPNV